VNDNNRLDVYLTQNCGISSRSKARALIMEGSVYINDCKQTKAGTPVKADDKVEVRSFEMPFVSRGGYKLDKAVKVFGIDLSGCVCIDVGASTGGFTDVMLQNGADKVYSVDVGYGQLAWKLRTDERVVCMERTNFRYLKPEDIPQQADFAGCDVSFISLKLMLPVIRDLLKDGGHAVCLIKPQFEAGRSNVGKNGVVRDINVHISVIDKVRNEALNDGFSVCGLDFSPVKGPQGNIEYLIYLEKSDSPADSAPLSDEVAEMSHEKLDTGSETI
jgi:23S rRNA (cytidine1920-2'-O)/16S rRNA (cytidine1409-2'-O)-methyltransferase